MLSINSINVTFVNVCRKFIIFATTYYTTFAYLVLMLYLNSLINNFSFVENHYFCNMKYHQKNIVALATVAILAITAYQAYWLIDIYTTLQSNLQKDIKEAMRASDFQEIAHRVNILKDQSYGGEMNISVGAEETHEKVTVKNEYQSREHLAEKQAGNDDDISDDSNEHRKSTVPYDEFDNALRDEEDVFRVGLYMQRGIHDGLDAILPINAEYYDSVLSARLSALGVHSKHSTLYIKHKDEAFDTLKFFGDRNIVKADTFALEINSSGNLRYILLVEKKLLSVPPQMHSAIWFSAFTLLILIVAFWYLINMIRSMRALDEMKSDFTNNITHELKTPIAVAYAANDALLNFNGTSDPKKLRKYLEICQEQLNLLTRLVEQILSLSMERRRNMKLTIEPVEVLPVVNKIIENHRLKATKPIKANIDVPQGISVIADSMHFANIINNLVDNAIKYSHDEVSLHISAHPDSESKTIITISDNGIGIDKEQQKYIFDKFYRVPHGNLHQVKGYGLGLYYVKNMMQRFGGLITVKSELNKGTTFKLIFNG